MSELNEERWAVISERGCEARRLKHADAAQLVRRLADERLSGLCVISDEAAQRLERAAQVSPNGQPPATKPSKSSRKRRAAKQ